MVSEVIGLVPAGGQATRLGPLPCSKEILPIGSLSGGADQRRLKVACQYLLESMRAGGINKAHLILRAGKWDIPAYLGDGSITGISLSYLLMRLPYGVPYTLDQAYPFVENSIVALGFPDIIFEPMDAFARLLDRLSATKADVVLGLFPTDQPEKADMVEFQESGEIQSITIKQRRTGLRYAWILAVWTPVFTRYLHEFVSADLERAEQNRVAKGGSAARELFISDVVQGAIKSGLRVQSEVIPEGAFLDIGTPDGLVKARQRYG
jgi:glucose-1-phosphate thymidylyltransferase